MFSVFIRNFYFFKPFYIMPMYAPKRRYQDISSFSGYKRRYPKKVKRTPQRAIIGRGPTTSAMWNTSLYKLNTPMPSTFPTRLRYFSVFTLNPGAAGSAGVQVFSANGLYDPDITSTGHQPRGFDQSSAMYKTFQVIKRMITVWFSRSFCAAPNSSTLSST